ncbi:MAG: glucokinase [Deltaproteobacteria bacterium]|nr:glucokinase [Deltaproteobacteria bacterium]
MILAGDVGGTKTTLAVYEIGVGTVDKVLEETVSSRDKSSLQEIVMTFIAKHQVKGLTKACFGVPGAVVDGVCKTTNLPWVINEAALAKALKVPTVKLLNDLQAAAYGMLFLDDSELVVLNNGRSLNRQKNLGVIAAGTGLGEALLVWDGEKHLPVASEGGHTSFAPRNELEVELWRFLTARYRGHVSWERVVSGPGLAAIYEFLRGRSLEGKAPTETAYVRDRMQREDIGAVVGVEAVKGADALCVATAKLFCSLYGAEAGNLALKGMCTGGVYVGGGIAPRILPLLRESEFMEAFVDKGRFKDLLVGVPVVVSQNDKAPLIGAAHYASRLL